MYTKTIKTNQLKEVAPMRKVLVCLTVLVGLVLSLGFLASAEPVRKILVIQENSKEAVKALVESLGGQIIFDYNKLPTMLAVEIPEENLKSLETAQNVVKVHDDYELRIIPPRELDMARRDRGKDDGDRKFREQELTSGGDWGYDRIDVEEIHFQGISRILGALPQNEPTDKTAGGLFILIGSVGLGAALWARVRGRRGLYLALFFIAMPLWLAGCGGVARLILGEGVRVAILDSGIDPNHPDLNGNVNIALSANFVGTGPCGTTAPCDDNGHGTFVAGIVGAKLKNRADGPGRNRKIGVAPRAELVSVKVCSSSGSCPTSAILAGLNHVLNIGAQVANMSLGTGLIARSTVGTSFCRTKGDNIGPGNAVFDSVLSALAAANITLVVAAGNSGGNIGPGANGAAFGSCHDTIAVAAAAPGDQMADFSNYGADVEVAAPGDYVFSTNEITFGSTFICYPGNLPYCSSSGTSFSTPYVTGLAALLYSIGINTPSAVLSKLLTTADNVLAPYGSIQPEPLIDAEEAVLGTQNGDN